MITKEQADTFAHNWIADWNAHDINKIIEHYAPSVQFTSPMIVSILNRPNGQVSGKAELKAYFLKGLAAYPDLTFELYQVLTGVNCVVIYYKSVKNLIAAEVFIFNEAGKVQNCFCNYKEI